MMHCDSFFSICYAVGEDQQQGTSANFLHLVATLGNCGIATLINLAAYHGMKLDA
jgi:hypothetical protein